MTNLAEIQDAIEKLAPEERAALRDWLDEYDLVATGLHYLRLCRGGDVAENPR
jgi:hypothetical protein